MLDWKISIFMAMTSLAFQITIAANATCCIGNLCFSPKITEDIIMPPARCPNQLGIQMTLYTTTDPTFGTNIYNTEISSGFDGNRQTIFLVHGLIRDDVMTAWQLKMRNKLFALSKNDYNIIVVKWDSGTLPGWDSIFKLPVGYLQYASDTRSVGYAISELAWRLAILGSSPSSRHYCIGHNLGAHVCGYAGEKTKFGRITGLDPAAPGFDQPFSFLRGLNKDLADFVDIIHTAAPFIGSNQHRGHVDFFPNVWLFYPQPGCESTDSVHAATCSHLRVLDLFAESISDSLTFPTERNCFSTLFFPLLCQGSTVDQSMGFRASSYTGRGVYYLETNGHSPYSRA